MVQSCASDPEVGLPISGIGGITTWRDAAEFIALGSTNVQVCTAIMHYGFRIVEDMIEGLNDYLDAKGFKSLSRALGRAVARRAELGDARPATTNGSPRSTTTNASAATSATSPARTARIRPSTSSIPHGHGLGPGRVPGKPVPEIKEQECVGCNLCSLVCPVDKCITMVERRKRPATLSWSEYQEHGLAVGAATTFPPHP